MAIANIQAWEDFRQIINIIEQSETNIQQLANYIIRLAKDKAEILDDTIRKAELKKIIDIHPDYTLTNLNTRVVNLETLFTYLQTNGYI